MPTRFTDADNHWGTGLNTDRPTAAVDAHYGAATTWDYYKTSTAGTASSTTARASRSRVHYGKNYVNAFWDGNCF